MMLKSFRMVPMLATLVVVITLLLQFNVSQSVLAEKAAPADSKKESAANDADAVTNAEPKPEVETETNGPKKAAQIFIEGPIDHGLYGYIKANIDKAKAAGHNTIIFKIDTDGGELGATFKITRAISDLKDIHTIAFITSRAYSAGSLISVACNDIVMAPETFIGDCQPIVMTQEGYKPLGEKILSPLRSKFETLADANGYPVALCKGFVDVKLEVYAFDKGDEMVFYEKRDYEELSLEVKNALDNQRTVVREGELLTINNKQSAEYGLSRATLNDLDAVKKHFAIENVTDFNPTWSESLARYLMSPTLSSLVLIVGLLCLWTEFKIPGFGAPGIVAICCFAVLIGSRFIGGLAEAPEILVFVAGIALIMIEIFLIPGTFVAGMTGFVCVLLGLYMVYTPSFVPQTPWDTSFIQAQVNHLMIALLIAVGGFAALLRILPSTPGMSKMALGATLASADSAASPQSSIVGSEGICKTDLHPSGKIEISNTLYDAFTEDGYVDAGERIKVIKYTMGQAVVERVTHEQSSPEPTA